MATMELPQDNMVVATLVHAGTDLPVERPSRERMDRLKALTVNDPTWQRED